MITLRIKTEVKDDRRVVLTLPVEVPTGEAELLVMVASPTEEKRPRSSLADWAAANAESWGEQISSEDVNGFTGRRF